MNTSVEIENRLLEEILQSTGLTTKQEAIEHALKTFLAIEKQKEILKFKGKLKWEDDLDAMRSW